MGVSNESTLTYFDIQAEDGTLQLPLDWTVLYNAAAARNVSLHSISWGINYTAGVYDETASDLDWLTLIYDILPCASSGNDGPTGMVNSPCTCKNCLCTGGATANSSYIASFTSQGVLDPRPHMPVVAALAVNVTVAESLVPAMAGHADFTLANGTSMASPAICGLAALVDQFFMNATGVRASAAMKIAAVVNSATYATGLVDSNNNPVVGYSDLSFGVPNLNFAIATYFDRLVTSGGSVTKCFITTATTVSITLAYIDLPAMPFVSNVMVRLKCAWR
jgi:subtilisin family serine protease